MATADKMAFDPKAWAEGATALKAGFDMFRSAIGFAKDLRSGGTPEQQETYVKALTQASSTAAINCRWVRTMVYPLSKIEP